jgi:integrase
MPIKLIPPRKGFSPYYYGRGTYLGVFVNRSTQASRPALAKRIIKAWESEIERGRFNTKNGLTFMSAAVSYIKAGGDKRALAKLIAHFGEKLVKEIDQRMIDTAAAELFPSHSNATRNREVYSPVSAVLKHAGLDFRIRRPKGSRGRVLTGWLWPEEAERLIREAVKIDPEFGLLCLFLLFTGLRLSEGTLRFTCDKLRLSESYAFIPTTKNGEPRPVYLPPQLVAALANHPRGLERGHQRVFRHRPSGRLYALLYRAAEAAGVNLPNREAFHIFRHTYGAWMRRYAGSDLRGWSQPAHGNRSNPLRDTRTRSSARKRRNPPCCRTSNSVEKMLNSKQMFNDINGAPSPSHGRGRRFNPYSAHHYLTG